MNADRDKTKDLHPPSEISASSAVQCKAQNVEITQAVIGAAMKVLNTLRPGLDEKLYERALVIELRTQGIVCEQQKSHEVFYNGHLIGVLVPDLIVDGRLIVDAKVVTDFNDSHVVQMLGYLKITGLKTALLLNFKHSKLGIKRVSNSTAGNRPNFNRA
jgi:GxxExxY protein